MTTWCTSTSSAGLDWIDVVSASKADPKETSRLAQSLSPWPQSSPGYFASVKEKLVRIISTGQLGIFKNGYWGHPGYKFPPEANLMLVAHYIEALDFQKDVVQIHTVFGGKNPHPNWLVGGVPLALNINGKGGADVINMERLELVLSIIKRCREFSAQVLRPRQHRPRQVLSGVAAPRHGPLQPVAAGVWGVSVHRQRLLAKKPAHPRRGNHQRQLQ